MRDENSEPAPNHAAPNHLASAESAAPAASAARKALPPEAPASLDGAAPAVPWWGEHSVPVGQSRWIRIGPLSLWVRRDPGEWRLAYERGSDPMDATVFVGEPTPRDDLLDRPQVTRFALEDEGERIRLEPRLADRPVVSQPKHPFVLLGREQVVVHVSTPLWVAVLAGTPERLLAEIPTVRPSDTWFGPDTRTGEMAYTNRAALRLRPAELPRRPHRAVTEVVLRNGSDEAIAVERLSLPVRFLSLREGDDGNLWTERMVYEREPSSDRIQLRLRDSMRSAVRHQARQSAQGKRLCAPREPFTERIGVRALTSLFG